MKLSLGKLEPHAILLGTLVATVVGSSLYAIVGTDAGTAQAAPAAVSFEDAGTTDGAGSAGTGAAGGGAVLPSPSGTTFSVTNPSSSSFDAGGDSVASGTGSTLVPNTPSTPSTPTPTTPPADCPSDAAADAANQARAALSDALGQPVPGSTLGDLAEAAAGCSDADPTSALVILAVELASMVPDTGIAPIDLPIPGVPLPALPQEVADALAPLAPAVQEACSVVGLAGVLFAVIPSTANVPIAGSDLATVIGPASQLCGYFEPPTD
jgi:hypothetical protein